jgi:RES domain-containing protein
LRLYRVCRLRAAAAEAIDGYGAAHSPGRWNVRGVRAVYLASRVALGLLEVVVQSGTVALSEYAYYPILVPDELLTPLDRTRLGASWRTMARGRDECRALADEWRTSAASAGLVVPSAVVPEAYDEGEFNVVLDPEHHDFARVAIEAPTPLEVDPRIGSLLARAARPI